MTEVSMEFTADRLALPWTEGPFFEELLGQADLAPEDAADVRFFAENGYLVVEDLGFADLDERIARIRGELAGRYEGENRRVLDGWMFQEDVRALAIAEPVLERLRLLYRREPIAFQTLNFDVGTQQRAHSDIIHFNCVPRRFMCGVWIALEDIDAENGPLFYYPRSHRLPEYLMVDLGLPGHPDAYFLYEDFIERMVAAEGLERVEVRLKRGQALVWSANLVHGGAPVLDPARTRHSQVTHYYFRGGAYYIPLLSDFPAQLHVREVIDIKTREFVPQELLGHRLELGGLDNVWRYPRPLPPGVREG